jgi:hypothetical protein
MHAVDRDLHHARAFPARLTGRRSVTDPGLHHPIWQVELVD